VLTACLATILSSCGENAGNAGTAAEKKPSEISQSAPRTESGPDGSIQYIFPNGTPCLKKPDYTKAIQAEGAIKLKEIFETSGKYDSKMQRASEVRPAFQELDAALFDICYEYGSGRKSKEQYDDARQVVEEIRRHMLDPSGSVTPAKAPLKAHFVSGGFPSLQSHSYDQGPSGKWDCGPTIIEVNPTNLAGHVNEELHFTWDATRICMGLTIDAPAGKIAFAKDGAEVQTYDLPDSYGTAYVTFSQPGYYSGKLTYQAGKCRNVGGSQPCGTTGSVTVNITQ
jgi:hypothetical protein